MGFRRPSVRIAPPRPSSPAEASLAAPGYTRFWILGQQSRSDPNSGTSTMASETIQVSTNRATNPPTLDEQQLVGFNDMDPASFRASAHAAVDIMADYLEGIRDRPVMPQIEPGSIRRLLPTSAPEAPEPMGDILADYQRLIEPNATHWQHPRFLGYFASSASGPGIIGEMLAAVLNSNVMLWRTSPAGTELEQVVVDWLRQAMGLPPEFDGLLTDTASTSSMLAIAAARQAAGLDASAKGIAGRSDVPQLRVYASGEAHR